MATRTSSQEAAAPAGDDDGALTRDERAIEQVIAALTAAADGDFSVRVRARRHDRIGELQSRVNELIELNARQARELRRVSRVIGREGRMTERASLGPVAGGWAESSEAINSLIDDLVRPTTEVARVIAAVADGDLGQKIALTIEGQPVKGEFARIGTTVNTMVDQLQSFADEVTRVAREVGTEGRLGGQAEVKGLSGTWRDLTESVNGMAANLTDQVRQIAQVTTAVADGDLSQKINVEARGEVAALRDTINRMVDQLSRFAAEVTRVAREVGTDGRLGGQAEVKGVSGTWRELTENVNLLASNLTEQVRQISQVTRAVARGDLTQKITVEARGEVAELADTMNSMTDTLALFAEQVTLVAREVGTDGILGGQAMVPGVAGTWKDLTDSVNGMASNLTTQVRQIAQVTTAVANGDLTQKVTVEAKGEVAELADTINSMTDTLRVFGDQVTRVAREVGTEGILGGQAEVQGVSGTWRELTENVNGMASNLTDQVRNIAVVTTAVANGDLSQKITVDARGEIAQLRDTINRMVDQLRAFAAEVTRVAREVGTEGKLGGQAEVQGVSGTWRGLTENVNLMASNLTGQVRQIAQVTTAVANGDLSKKITVDAQGEIAELKDTINTMVDQLQSFAAEVTRVAREVGTEGKLGGQAEVQGVSGTWRDLTESVNQLAGNLTSQVRNIAQVTTAVANGDMTQKITVDARGEILELKDTVNTMVDQLSSFAAEVTRVSREVGTEGKLGGQARVEGVSGMWRDLTENVNVLAANLTTQVRAIADVSTAVTEGDLTRQITVETQGELAELKDRINEMIANLRDTTQQNAQQDWLKTNLARISAAMQGRRDLVAVSRLLMSEVTPLVDAQHGAFFVTEDGELRLIASYGYQRRRSVSNRFAFGEGLVGQAALEGKPILVSEAPADYVKVTSGLGEALPVNLIVLPILFEEQVIAVIELGSLRAFSALHQSFLEQLAETTGVVLSNISANRRTEELLEESQRLAEELQSQQDELKRSNLELEQQAQSLKASEELLQTQQEELRQTNDELKDKARLLERQNRAIEDKNAEIERAREALEERAAQLALSSKYKSEFLANMSHELRTPLNSLLILSKLLADNGPGNLSDEQVEFAHTIHTAGTDLLALISDILDLSKVEAGKMEVTPVHVPVTEVLAAVERAFRPVAEQKELTFDLEVSDDAPAALFTDEQRLTQVLRNLLSNAFKFTDSGLVGLRVAATDEVGYDGTPYAISFTVSDTGIGIAEDKLRVIFESFQQADGTTSRRYGGTGLGLSISREIARLLGGEIRVRSTPGEGSAFTLLLPATYEPPPVAPEPEPQDADGIAHELLATVDAAERQAAAPVAQADDRARIAPGDRVVLIVGEQDEAELTLAAARARRLKGIVALDGPAGLALAHEQMPDAIVLAAPAGDAALLLDQLKHHPKTRHIPVCVIAAPQARHAALRAGAARFLERPAARAAVDAMLGELTELLERTAKRVLVVEDDEIARRSVAELIGGDDVEVTGVGSSEEALAELEGTRFDCVVLDLKLPQATGFELLERIKEDARHRDVPVIIHTGRALTRRDETRLKRYADAIVVKDAASPERLLDETALHLHRAPGDLPDDSRRMLESLHQADSVLHGRKVLIVDDDVRNVFALTSVLESRGMTVLFAENGREGLEVLDHDGDVDLVLMDLMMPEMDGYEATAAIRARPEGQGLPIIALTAKAMQGDRERSIAAGASDYVTKPVDPDQLLSLMRVWLYR